MITRPPLSIREAQVLNAWRQHWNTTRRPPSRQEMADAINAALGQEVINPAAVGFYLTRMKRKGYMRRDRGTMSWYEVDAMPRSESDTLRGNTREGLHLTIELTGPSRHVIREAEDVIAHLRAFVEHLHASERGG